MDCSLRKQFCVTLAESETFARSSGDYNPLHVDPVQARRTPFGSTVVHGIHLLLKSFEEAAAAGLLQDLVPDECSVTFNNPVHTGAEVTLEQQFDRDTRRLRMSATAQHRAAFTATVKFADAANAVPTVVDHSAYSPAMPRAASFPTQPTAGDVPLRLPRSLLAELFPRLAGTATTDWIADLLASTYIVGMQCPGMNSIYSGMRLQRAAAGHAAAASMHYEVAKADARFRLVRLQVRGSHFNGTLETFFRPPPVDQPSLADIGRSVPEGSYAGAHALVLGGSRGLGEIAAKAVLAGGGKVTITYARGRADAQRICDEARALQRECSAEQLELEALLSARIPQWLAAGAFTHIYYFASPHIGKTAGTHWDPELFGRFCRVYVDAFAVLARTVRARFLYPSSIFVEQPEKGFAEYAAAKAAGETLCDYLARSQQIAILHPRLPRMRTDQTNSLLDSGVQDPVPVILDLVRQLHE